VYDWRYGWCSKPCGYSYIGGIYLAAGKRDKITDNPNRMILTERSVFGYTDWHRGLITALYLDGSVEALPMEPLIGKQWYWVLMDRVALNPED